MKKPPRDASPIKQLQYRSWVREQLVGWHPADEKQLRTETITPSRRAPCVVGDTVELVPTYFHEPRHNGVRASDPEMIQEDE